MEFNIQDPKDVVKMYNSPLPEPYQKPLPYDKRPIEEQKEFEEYLLSEGFDLDKTYPIPDSSGMSVHKRYVNWTRSVFVELLLERGKGSTNFYFCSFGILKKHYLEPQFKSGENHYKSSFDYCKDFLNNYRIPRGF